MTVAVALFFVYMPRPMLSVSCYYFCSVVCPFHSVICLGGPVMSVPRDLSHLVTAPQHNRNGCLLFCYYKYLCLSFLEPSTVPCTCEYLINICGIDQTEEFLNSFDLLTFHLRD